MTDTFTDDDELLSAHIDGALPPDRAALLERRLEAEPALARRLKQLERANSAVRDAYAPIAAEPLPQRVLDLIDAAPKTARSDADVVDLAARRGTRGLRFAPLPTSLAAGVALAIGLALGYVVASRGPEPDVALIARAGAIAPGALHEVLETAASATTRDIGRGVSVTPVLTFRSVDGDYCRQVDIAGPGGGGEAVACRRDGYWDFKTVSFSLAIMPTTDGFRPASRSSVIDAAIDERIEGDPLDTSAEEALIEQGWARQEP
jgi:hypothetical protein